MASNENQSLMREGKKLLRGMTSLIGLLAIVFVLAVTSPVFLTVSNLMNILVQVAVVAVIAAGSTAVILTGGIDLSVGAVMALSGVLSAGVMRGTGDPFTASLVCIGVGLSCGLLAGLMVTVGRMPPFVATLSLMSIARGLSFIYTGGKPISGFPDSFRFFGAGFIAGMPVMILLTLLVYIVMYIVLKRTPFGRVVYAIGSNEEATRLTGINTSIYKLLVYTVAGLLTGLAALMYVGRINSGHPASGSGYEMDAIAAVVIGGTSLSGGKGKLVGTIIGALIMGVIRNGLNLLNVDPFWQSVVLGVIIAAAVMLDQRSNRSR
jgi:ribose transport system permease protein